MDTPKHSVSVAAVITDDQGRALLIQRRDNSRWEPPGGVLELDETIEDGLRREVREETGLVIEPGQLTGVYKNMLLSVLALVFRCKVIGGRLATNEEAIAFRWANEHEIFELAQDTYGIRMLDALADHPSPRIRHHDGARVL